jgi:hypothetical protein
MKPFPRLICSIFVVLSVLATFPPPVLASNTRASPPGREKSLGTFRAWRAFSEDEDGQKICYMVTTKVLKSSAPKQRSQAYLMITHRPTEGSTDVVSYGAGLLINPKYGAKVHTAKSLYDFFSVKDTAWARDAQTDHKVAAMLLTLPSVQISAMPQKKASKSFTDQFDLSGGVQAYQAIGKACGLIHALPSKNKKPMKKS